MQPTNIINNVKINDDPVECYYTGFKKNNTLNNTFYKEFSLNTTTYTVGNFVINEENSVAKILCIFIDQSKIVQLVVRKYPFAKFLKIKDFNTSLEDNEIVEDLTKDCTIPADKVMTKCFVIFGNENESASIIKENNLDPFVYFFCRYSLKSDGLFPIFFTPSVILGENNMKHTPRKLLSEKKQKPKCGLENKNVLVSNENKPNSKSAYKDINVSPSDSSFFSPVQRNLVRRNLNDSFDAYNTETNSILNYSIVSDEDIENPLLLKLRISESNKEPLVLIKKLDDFNSSMKKKECVNTPIRKSSRKIQRISYADYISPIKLSPRKRCNSNSSLNEGSPNKRQLEKLGQLSDLNKNRNSGDNAGETTLGKIIVRTPKRYQAEMEWDPLEKLNSKESARRSLRLTISKEFNEDDKTCGNRAKRERSVTVDTDTKPVKEKTPQKKKVNLNESIRRTILKVNLKKGDEDILIFNNQKLRKEKSNQKYINGYLTSSDSEESVHLESVISSSPKTPKRTKKQNESDSDQNFSPKTPKINTDMTPKNSVKQTPKTPRNRAKLIRDGIITPSMQSRSKAISGDSTPLMKARSQLHVSYVPSALPCRDTEYRNILEFLESALLDGCGGCMYVSGVPGTGKTATVSSVISYLQRNNNIPKFNYVNINGMRLTEPRQSYVEILKQLTGKTVPWEQAQSMLEEKFTKSKKMAPTVMLVDELDILYTKRQDVVYNLLDWPTKAKNQLVVITIANTMDLPERLLMNRVASRLGLTRLTFQAYTHKQLQEIVKNRLSGIKCFNPDAVEFVARKVASVSGDARRALDICRRAAEIAETESSIQLVNMSHVNKAVNAMITQPKVRAIKNCSRLEQLILQSIVAEVERTGVEETTFSDVFKMLVSCAAIEGFKMVSSTNAFAAVSRLSASRLILSDSKCNDVSQKLILNVSIDDVYYALKKDQS